jgi:hypothetical protein
MGCIYPYIVNRYHRFNRNTNLSCYAEEVRSSDAEDIKRGDYITYQKTRLSRGIAAARQDPKSITPNAAAGEDRVPHHPGSDPSREIPIRPTTSILLDLNPDSDITGDVLPTLVEVTSLPPISLTPEVMAYFDEESDTPEWWVREEIARLDQLNADPTLPRVQQLTAAESSTTDTSSKQDSENQSDNAAVDATADPDPKAAEKDPTDPLIHDLPWNLCEIRGPERIRISEVIKKHRAMFSSKKYPNLGLIKGIEFKIETGDHPPIRSKSRRVKDPQRRADMKECIDIMTSQGVVRRINNSAWASPVVMVPKPDGSWRFCVDYRHLNKITKSDVYPMPRMDDLLDCMSTSYLKSSLDLNSGYWQIPMRPEDIEKTTFICDFGTYAYHRMPFGAKNSGATFQRAMDEILGEDQWSRAPTYIDNVGVWTRKEEDHIAVLDRVMTRFHEAGATFNSKKCEIGCFKISYLGLVVDIDGIHLSESRTAAIKAIPVPKDIARVASFLGMTGWCRRFVKDYSRIALPLTELKNRKGKFEWKEEHQKSFEALKKAMSSMTVMKLFEFDKPCIVQTDASKEGIGAVLLQKDDNGQTRVIEYASHKSNKMQANFTSEEMECWAVVWAVTRWKPYLYLQHFILQTDNRALTWLLTKEDLHGRLARCSSKNSISRWNIFQGRTIGWRIHCPDPFPEKTTSVQLTNSANV